MVDLTGKLAVVTGSTTGIGLGIAHHLAAKGCSVVITGLGEPDLIHDILKDFAEKYPKGRFEFIEGDLIKEESTLKFCETVLKRFPDGIDILINNAGIQYICNIDEYPNSVWNNMIAISLTAPFLLTKHFIPKMKEKNWGRIISLSSQMGHVSSVGRAPYSAVKTGIIGFSKGVALEAAPYSITCNCICPGFVDAPTLCSFMVYFIENLFQAEFVKTQNPTQRLITIDQIAEMVIYLCSPGADNITGTSLLVDGGFTAK
ncbi:hypothetical protein LOTGIDRAFT_113742 [Lottia gigantea]|uniref:3-oxoacyl-[acyl-carrier-protein] reductase n=1 Tax=Lottia gigantea TaxID=225164 RepID=V4A4V9_LOTGI|nr:hypothetical protein LOTGIDRAFT_113742 [Lottia gigantea]ESO98918.1 hypothetical protein LOTGIDRAFT_113742 [Lottia gigantea]